MSTQLLTRKEDDTTGPKQGKGLEQPGQIRDASKFFVMRKFTPTFFLHFFVSIFATPPYNHPA
jgi:hypothetical protein